MFVKKTPIIPINTPTYSKRLEDLYARRSTLDNLIQTLEQYDRFRAKSEQGRKRKTA